MASPATPTSIALTWSQAAGEVVDSFLISYSYTVRGCLGEDGASTQRVGDGTVRIFTLAGVQENSVFTISLQARNGKGGTSQPSASITVTTSEAGKPL